MRTTIELPDPLYRRLRSEAAALDMRGFSPIVEAALTEYFDRATDRNQLQRNLEAAAGSWSEADVSEWEQARRDAWQSWQTDPSSTPTS